MRTEFIKITITLTVITAALVALVRNDLTIAAYIILPGTATIYALAVIDYLRRGGTDDDHNN